MCSSSGSAPTMEPASGYDRALYASLPIWYNAIYAVAVGCRLFAAVALLARSVLAIPLAVAASAVWLARRVRARGWIR